MKQAALWLLFLAPFAVHADPAADAAAAGLALSFPAWETVSQNPDFSQTLGDLTANTAQLEALRQDGQGKLYAPGRSDVEGCTLLTDPRCTAVNIVDRGAANRPTVDPDLTGGLLAGRDDIVGSAGDRVDLSGSVSGSTGTCTPIYSEIEKPSETRTCEQRIIENPGDERTETCTEAWEEILASFSRWRCRTTLFNWEERTCSQPVVVPVIVNQTVACWEGKIEATTETCPVTVTQEKSEKWLAACLRPRWKATTSTCTQKLQVIPQASCKAGERVADAITDHADLTEDRAPGAETLELSYQCDPLAAAPRLTLGTNSHTGGPVDITVSTAETEFSLAHSWPGTRVLWEGTLQCTERQCLADVTMTVWEAPGSGLVFSGTLSKKFLFTPFGLTGEKEQWITTCL